MDLQLDTPWSAVFLPDGTAVISERDTALIKVVRDGRATALGKVPGVVPGGEGGLLGLALSPDFGTDHYLYAYVTAQDDNRVVRLTLNGTGDGPLALGRPETVFSGIPKAETHNGGRIRFGPDGLLYVGTGDAQRREQPQDPNALGGKILRLTPDGRPAPGNPWPGSPVWTMGHRNVQGLAFDGSGRLWATEFGASTWDELNRIDKGRNYGWPLEEGRGDDPAYRNPYVQWRTDDASPSGLAYLDGSLWAAALRGGRLWQIPLRPGGTTSRPRDFFVGAYGRLRTVVAAPDGNLWVTTSNRDGRGNPAPQDDRILVVSPR
ncbi:MAG TPA: PQQ-dependent sugar dehydrogenase [Streptomyces sp.]|nr:PQQ-dependent sugar dehydrogenase [Streptomyces sp.]